jgi:hypothetical protein
MQHGDDGAAFVVPALDQAQQLRRRRRVDGGERVVACVLRLPEKGMCQREAGACCCGCCGRCAFVVVTGRFGGAVLVFGFCWVCELTPAGPSIAASAIAAIARRCGADWIAFSS